MRINILSWRLYYVFLFNFLIVFFFGFPIYASQYGSTGGLSSKRFYYLLKKRLSDYQVLSKESDSFEDYSLPSSNNKKPQTLRACIIDLSPLKDKKQELLNHIKNPNNWSEKYIHPSLYDKYHRYGNRRFKLDGNSLVIYVPLDGLLWKILDAAKNTDCLPLNSDQIQEDKIPKGSLFNKGCSIRVQDHRLKPGSSLYNFYKQDQAIDNLFKSNFKNQFIIKLKAPDIFKENIENTIIYSKLSREKSNPIAPDSSQKIISDSTQAGADANPDDRSLDDDIDADPWLFEIHIIQTQDLKSFILKENFQVCLKINSNSKLPFLLTANQFYRGCQTNVKDLPISFDQNHLNNAFNDSRFKLRLIRKINDHFNFKDQPYPNESILKTSDLKDGSFHIFIVETQNKIVQPNIQKIKKASNELIHDFLYQAEKRQCLSISDETLKKMNISLFKNSFLTHACQMTLNHKEIKRNGLLNKNNIQNLIHGSFKRRLIQKINLKRKPPFNINKTLLTYYLKKSDGKLIIILYQSEKIKDLKNIISISASSSFNLTEDDKKFIENESQ